MYIKFLSILTVLVIGLPLLTSAATACPTPGVTMKRGSSGADVTRLQQILAQDKTVYPEGTITGTYGALTEAAVQRFQAKNGIVSSGTPDTTGYGAVGSRTAAAIAALCSGSTVSTGATGSAGASGGFIAIAPYAGGSSRSISVQVTVNAANSCNAATYVLDYGDNMGTSPIAVPTGSCKAQTSTVNHTYQLAGTYQVSLSSGSHKTSVAVAVN